MSQLALTSKALFVTLLLAACGHSEAEQARPSAVIRDYEATDGSGLRATLVVDAQRGAERLASATHFEDGRCLMEEATLDRNGKLLRASSTLSGGDAVAEVRVVLEPANDRVEVTYPTHQVRWSAPNDHPWVWAPLLATAGGPKTIATPLAALVTLRSAQEHFVLRTIDLAQIGSNTILSDQLLVPDGAMSVVVVGDDAVDVVDGLPVRWRNAALDRVMAPRARDGILDLLAAFSCNAPEQKKT